MPVHVHMWGRCVHGYPHWSMPACVHGAAGWCSVADRGGGYPCTCIPGGACMPALPGGRVFAVVDARARACPFWVGGGYRWPEMPAPTCLFGARACPCTVPARSVRVPVHSGRRVHAYGRARASMPIDARARTCILSDQCPCTPGILLGRYPHGRGHPFSSIPARACTLMVVNACTGAGIHIGQCPCTGTRHPETMLARQLTHPVPTW